MRDAFGRIQTIVLIGGTSEIGVAVLRRLLPLRPDTILLAGRDEDALHETLQSLPQGIDIKVLLHDVTSSDTHEAFVESVFAHGDIDIVVLAVGELPDQNHAEADHTVAARSAQVNFAGPMSLLLLMGKRLQEQGHGTVVVLSSWAALRGRASNFVYGATKAGLDTLAEGMAVKWGNGGPTMIVVRPGFVKTRMSRGLAPPPFSVDADDVAKAVGKTLSGSRPRSQVLWVPPVGKLVGLILRIVPWWVLRRLP